MKYVVYDNPDGTLSIVGPMNLAARLRRGLNVEQAVAHQAARETAAGRANVRTLDTDDGFPTNRKFREAWRIEANAVAVDMPIARNIHMNRIRASRDVELAKIDLQVTRALAVGDQAAVQSLEAQRQTLRDIPQTFDLDGVSDPDALDALWPPGLPKPA